MSRTTQYIGLNEYAKNFVRNAIKTEIIPNMATGMFDEPIEGTRYYMPVPKGPNTSYYFDEEVQAEPWSSGPMIFTCLRGHLVKECGQVIDMDENFCWMLDPSLEGQEYDEMTGRYYV